jgi:hypothetical protein
MVVGATSAHVGPFDLGTVLVHLPLDINPQTAVVSIPEGPAEQIPHIIKGIVINLRNIRTCSTPAVRVCDRPGRSVGSSTATPRPREF